MVNWILPVRVAQLVFAIIALGISARIVAFFGDDSLFFRQSSYAKGNFALFTSLWTILIEIYLIGIQFVFKDSAAANPIISIVLDGLSWIFWLASFAAIASDISTVNGDGHWSAFTAFGVLEWLLFSVTLGFAIFAFLKRSGSKSGGSASNGV